MTEVEAIRVAVVGSSSQIGQSLLTQLAAAGHVVYCVGRKSKASTDGATVHVFDEPNCCFRPPLPKVDAVISLAPLPSIEVVVKMAHVLCAKRVIAFGSTGRFSKVGSSSQVERDFVAQQERAEEIFSALCETSELAWTLFRPTMIYGADADQNVSFIKSSIRKFGFFPLPIGANGLRQPVHVDDLAKACVLALKRATTANRAYNLGGGEVLPFSKLVQRIFLAEGRRPILIPIPMWMFWLVIVVAKVFPRAAFVRQEMVERMFQDLVVDNSAAKNDFGYEPQDFQLKDRRAG